MSTQVNIALFAAGMGDFWSLGGWPFKTASGMFVFLAHSNLSVHLPNGTKDNSIDKLPLASQRV